MAPATPADAGDSYVVFGKASGFAAEIDLAASRRHGGFVIHGQDAGDQSGYSVSSAGDINGDGFDDLIVGALVGDGPGNTRARPATATWCSATPAASRRRSTSPRSPPATAASSSMAKDADDIAGQSVSSAGDINGDGFADLIVGARRDGPGNSRAGTGDSYVRVRPRRRLCGGDRPRRPRRRHGGFVIHGQDAGDHSGWSVSSAGDVNGDGFDDLIVGALRMPTAPATHCRCRRQLCGVRQGVGLRGGDRPRGLAAGNGGFVIHGDAADYTGESCPRPATSTATASTT